MRPHLFETPAPASSLLPLCLLLLLLMVVGTASNSGCAPRETNSGGDNFRNNDNGNTDNPLNDNDNDDEKEPEPPPDPYRVVEVELASAERGFAWRMPGIGLTVEVHFAAAPYSRLDLLRDDAAVRDAAMLATRDAVTTRLIEAWEPILAWLAEQVPEAGVAATLAEQGLSLTLLLHEGDAAAALLDSTQERASVRPLEFVRFAEPGTLEGLLWRELLPNLPAGLAYGLGRLGPERATSEAAWLTREYAWIWATHFGLRHEDTVEVAPLMRGERPLAELTTHERWQLVDFVAFFLGTAGFAKLGTLTPDAATDWDAWQARWIEDRREWAGDDAEKERNLEALWRLDRGEIEEAFAPLRRPLPTGTLRTERRAVVHDGLGRLAFLAGDARFCRLWLTERLLSEAHHRVLIQPHAPTPPALLVPVVDVPVEAVAGAAFDEASAAELAASVLLEAGRPELALLVRTLRGMIDGSPHDPHSLGRLKRWAESPYGCPKLAEFVRAWAESEAGDTSTATERADALPEPYASAWHVR